MTVEASTGSIETKAEETKQGTDPIAVWKLWNEALNLASKEEGEWRKAAKKCQDIYANEGKDEDRQKFNILFSNVETIVPAIYNSPPVPDVRRRFNDDDPDAKTVADVIERCISFAVDTSAFDKSMKSNVMDAVLPGRGVSRVQYMPFVGQDATGQPTILYQQVYLQAVQWDDFRHGPAKTWEAVPWVAFRHLMTREQLVQLNPEVGPAIKLDAAVDGFDDKNSNAPPDLFKRAVVWEIWDKESKHVLFQAESYKNSMLAQMAPPITTEGFFPCPEPMRSIYRTDSLVPIEPYRLYAAQAKELDDITKRLAKLIKVMRWRGIRAKALGDAFEKIQGLDDGELAPAENAMEVMQSQGSMENGVWLMPIDKLITVIRELAEQRERVKQVVYEITGIADIMRGASKANETLGAQQIKTQWGTLRVQELQKSVQSYARDVFRIMAEVIAEKFTPQVIALMTGVQLTPQQVQLMQSDVTRKYRIDIETDSTIRADVTQAQQNISGFVQGLAQFTQAVGPMVQQGAMPPEVAIEMLVSFSRVFKLGRQVESALDSWKQKVTQMAQNPPPPKPTPEMIEEQAKGQREQARNDADMAMRKMDNETKIIVAAIQAAASAVEATEPAAAPVDGVTGALAPHPVPAPQPQKPDMSGLMSLVVEKLEQVFGGPQHAALPPQAPPQQQMPQPQAQMPPGIPIPPMQPPMGSA